MYCEQKSSIFILILLALLAVTEGWYFPVFVRKQAQPPPPPPPAVDTRHHQWGPQSNSIHPSQYNNLRDYQQAQNQIKQVSQMSPMAPVQMSQVAAMPPPQYTYDPSIPLPIGPPMNQPSAYSSVQLVPCLCPITRDVIEQQAAQQIQQAVQQQQVESGSNTIIVQDTKKTS